MNKKKIKIFLSGGSGMLGKNILEHASAKEYIFLAPTSRELDLMDYNNTIRFLQTNQVDYVIHCAGYVGGIQANIKEPVEFLNKNLIMGINMINAAKAGGIKNLLNIASSCMYPTNYAMPLKEEYLLQAALEPTNEGYALAKIAVAKLCEYMNRQYQLNYKTLIPCNLYGRWDKFSKSHAHMVAAVIQKTAEAKKNTLPHIEAWGDGSAKREFMLAEDCADAIYFCLNQCESIPQYLNVGMGRDYSIKQYYQMIASALNYLGDFTYDLSKPEGMSQKLLSSAKINTLGWKPKHSIESGIQKACAFYMQEYGHV